MSKYYVYHAYGKSGELLYVGMGTGERYKHCIGGASSNKNLNRYFFNNGEDGSIRVEIISYHSSKEEAYKEEREQILSLRPSCNSAHQTQDIVICSTNFKTASEMYYDAWCNKTNRSEEDVKDTLELLRSLNKDLDMMLDVISIEDIKNTSFNKTKSKTKYKKVLAIEAIAKNKTSAYKNLKIKEGDFLSYPDIKIKIQKCFDSMGIRAKAKATDIKDVFNVKRTARNGVEGFLIVSKI